MALPETVDVHHPAEAGVGLEPVQLALQEESVGAQVHEPAPVQQRLGHLVDLWMKQRLTPGDGHHRRPALLDGGHGLIDAQALAQHLGGVLDLAAPVALQVAGEQRLELDNQREFVPAGQLLAGQVGPDLDALAERNWHLSNLHR
jgi:hypothetical protein